MITLTIQGKNAAEIRQELKSLLAEAAAKKKEFKPAPISVSAEVAEAVKVEKTETEPAEAEPAKTEPAEAEPAKTEPAKTEPAKTEPAETPVTITEVRQALKDTADAFGLEAAQEILHKYAPKLADLSADKYADLFAELKEKLG